MIKKQIILGLLFMVNLFSFNAQVITVIDIEDNQPIPYARIDIKLNSIQKSFNTEVNGELILASEYLHKPIDLTVSYSGYNEKTFSNLIISKDTTIALISEIRQFDEVAITAQYKSQRVENAVHSIKVIDNQKIEAMAAQDLGDVLSNELNVRISEDQVLGSALKLQGIGGENVKILVDDVPLTGRLNGNIDLSQIPLENIERIEIIEGPLSVSYGTDALAGTINIITKKNQANKFESSLNNYFESSGKVNNTVTLGLQLNKHQIRLEGGRHFFDGWDPSHKTFHFNPNPIADSTRFQLWKPKIQYFAGINYRYSRNRAVFNYSGQFFNENIINKGMPRPPFQETAFDDYYNTKRLNQRLMFEYRFQNDYRLNIIAAYNGYFRRKNTKIRDLTTITDVISANPSDQDTSQYHSFISRGRMIQAKPDKNFNYEVGYDFLYEIAVGNRMLDSRQSIGDYAFYVTAEYSPIKELTIRPGVRYGYNTDYRSPITPSLNLKYTFYHSDLGGKGMQIYNLRASYARGFRSPSIKELHYTFIDINHNIVGNPDLKAESANNYSLSFHHDLMVKKFRIRTKISGFYTDIRNLITLALIEGSFTEYSYHNLERFASVGGQLETNFSYQDLSSTVGFSYIGRNNHLAQAGEIKSTGFRFSPEVKINLQYNWSKIGLQASVFYKYTGKLPTIYRDSDGEIYESLVGDYHTADLTLSKTFWQNRIKLTLGIKNLFDVKTVPGTEGSTDIAESAHASGADGMNIGMGRTFNLGIKIYLKSKQ